MFQIMTSSAQIDFGQIMQVYQQSLRQTGLEMYRRLDMNQQLLEAEQDFYFFLKSFLRERDSVFAVWITEGRYVSALRAEPYRDGVLIEGLETALEFRNKGYAKQLLGATVQYLKNRNIHKIYSHIQKDNIPSVRTHLSCGFICVCEYAAYVDGSIDRQSCTYLYEK